MKKIITISILIPFLGSMIILTGCKKDDDDNNVDNNFGIPVLTTTDVSGITQNTAISGGNIICDSGATVTVRGVCWSVDQNPTISDSCTTDGNGTGIFVSNLTELISGTPYYVRAYATNSVGTAYGDQISFVSATAYTIGQNFGGGIIFYIDGTNQHGLIAAPTDQSSNVEWGCYGTSIPGATSSAIGSGQVNTTAIVNGCNESGIAAKICDNLVLNGYSDWFLPSKGELYQMYINRFAIGGFGTNNFYWSSTEYDTNLAWHQQFNSYGGQVQHFKGNFSCVRAIRAF